MPVIVPAFWWLIGGRELSAQARSLANGKLFEDTGVQDAEAGADNQTAARRAELAGGGGRESRGIEPAL